MIETLFCTIDKKPIPEPRAVRNSNTCSKGCAKKLRAIRRARANERACQVCGKPSTPQQRASYRRWLASNPATAPRKRGRPAAEPTSAADLREILALAALDVPLETIEGWNEAERATAKKWAVASDNPVRVPPKPEFLKQCEAHAKPHPEGGGTVFDLA